MKKKRGQITLFIILGVVLLVIIGLILFMSRYKIEGETELQLKRSSAATFSTKPMKDFVKTCLDLTIKEMLFLLGRQGGFPCTIKEESVILIRSFFVSPASTTFPTI